MIQESSIERDAADDNYNIDDVENDKKSSFADVNIIAAASGWDVMVQRSLWRYIACVKEITNIWY